VITTVLTFLSERIVSVVITTVVVVAAVPTLIVAINGNTITITTGPVASTSRQHDDEERARIIVEVKNAGSAVIVKLNNEDAGCGAQIAQLAAHSTVSATATATAIQKGKDEFHKSVTPFVNEIKADEDELEHLTVVTTETEQTFLVRINEVQVIALGENGQVGALITVCQTIIVEIQQIIVVVQPAPGGEKDSDIRTVR
jgi:hypothetical protein